MADTKGKPIKCRAAVVWEKCEPYVIEEIEVAPPNDNEIRIKVVSMGVCHSDLTAQNAVIPFAKFPTVLGHEAGGIVESVGKNITGIEEGDHVLASFLPNCGSCPACKSPNQNVCVKFLKLAGNIGYMGDGTTRMTCKGKTLYHFVGCSTFAEYAVLEQGSFTKITKEVSLEKVSILSCGVTTGYGGPVKTAKVKEGSTCAVFGLGTVGLGAVMGCRNQGATRIIGIDINDAKKDLAKTFGMTEFYNPKDYDKPIHEVLTEKTGGGCDYTFECIGNLEVVKSALTSCRMGEGKCVIIGVTPGGKTVDIDPYLLMFGREITGCWLGGFKNEEIPGLVDDYIKKKLLVDEFITHTMTFEEINEAFDLMVQGKSLKTVLHF